jgi:hypothetical protein
MGFHLTLKKGQKMKKKKKALIRLYLKLFSVHLVLRVLGLNSPILRLKIWQIGLLTMGFHPKLKKGKKRKKKKKGFFHPEKPPNLVAAQGCNIKERKMILLSTLKLK